MPSPVEAERYIRFQLEHLTARNEHHTFEEICYRIAKRRLSSNLLPATGPVSAGGDQGRDAETYCTRLPQELPAAAGFVGRATTQPLVVACSAQKDGLEAKIRGDVKTICGQGGAVRAVAFFAVQEVPVAVRHRLQDQARETHGVTLEIFDGQAISHMLAEADLVWVAERYLDLPSHLVPDSPDEPQPDWYTHTLMALRQRDVVRLTPGSFSEVRDGLRHATFEDKALADLPEWLEYMHEFAADSDEVLAARARYECAVATLRGLNTLEGAEDDIRAVLDYAAASESPALLEDASVLLMYWGGAWRRRIATVPVGELRDRNLALRTRVRELIGTTEESKYPKLHGRINYTHAGTESARLRQILERLELDLLEPEAGTGRGRYGLGSSNLLFMACELLLLGKDLVGLPLLLVEEPEAHLHPQRQLRLMAFLTVAAETEIAGSRGVQVILTTHSPNLSSKIPLDNLVLIEKQRAFPLTKGATRLQRSDYRFLERFLDSTRANLFFARGLIVVEGDAEAILVPTVAKLIGCDLTAHGVSIINVGGTGLRRYARILQRTEGAEDEISVPVACLADMDVMPDCAPQILGLVDGEDDPKWTSPRRRWKAERDFGDQGIGQDQALADHRKRLATGDHANVRTFVSDHWTFEYDLAFSGLAEEVLVAVVLAEQDEAINAGTKDRAVIEATARRAFQALETESGCDRTRLCSAVYSRFVTGPASKAVAAQYLAEVLEARIKPDGTPEDGSTLSKHLPDYLVAALRYATRSEDPAPANPSGEA